MRHPNPPYTTTVTPTIPSPPPASQVQDLGYQLFVGFEPAHQPSFANLENHQAPHFGYQTTHNLALQNYFGYHQPEVELDPLSAQFQLLNEFGSNFSKITNR
ncbi:unnamed protein product [Orchesella dallaii]|uniref:Uncharacterized protein n=1 Tax=Orchesella dallaii TaxID=48710 RepID=A0ABP1QU88_9HEXA